MSVIQKYQQRNITYNMKKFEEFIKESNNTQESLNNKLISAVNNNSSIKVKELIELGADVNYINKYDEIPIITAIHYDRIKIIDELLKSKNINLEIKGLIEPDCISPRDSTPLFIASRGNLDIVKKLIKAGSIIDCIGHNGSTPLIESTAYKYNDVMIYLIKEGANMLIKNKYNDDMGYYLDDEQIELIKKECPIEYEKFLLDKESQKYNL